MCGESRMHGVNGGKSWRSYQRFTYPYQREATKEGGIYCTLIGDQRGGNLGKGNFRSCATC